MQERKLLQRNRVIRNAFKKKRCIIPADSFYEWENTDNGKVPMRIKLKSDGIFAIGGLMGIVEIAGR